MDNAEPEQTRYNAKKEGYESTEEIGLHLKERRNSKRKDFIFCLCNDKLLIEFITNLFN